LGRDDGLVETGFLFVTWSTTRKDPSYKLGEGPALPEIHMSTTEKSRPDIEGGRESVARRKILALAKDGEEQEIRRFLWKKNVNGHINCLSVRDRRGRTPLHIAAKHGNMGAVRCFVENGSDVFALDRKNRCPLFISALYGRDDVTEFFSDLLQ
jgi:Ankyrin repeats (3 copies)